MFKLENSANGHHFRRPGASALRGQGARSPGLAVRGLMNGIAYVASANF